MIKRCFQLAILSIILFSCNVNPSKEARIQKLETEIHITEEKVNELDQRVNTLENINIQLLARIQELENRN